MTKVINQYINEHFAVYHGDSAIVSKGIPDNSVGLSCYSPPFPLMYVYSNSVHDMGNVQSIEEMVDQFKYLQEHILRITMPGRNQFIHITQGVAQKQRDGFIGLKDFRGKLIEMISDIGWNYYGEFTIDRDPQLKAMRTKDHGLMFKSLVSDSAKMHCALPDIVLQFKKPGENPEPINAGISERYDNDDGWVTSNEWINWARPVWYSADYAPGTWREENTGEPFEGGIRETDVLNVRQARDTNDERHLCPLQLGVIERIVKVWSNPGDIVHSPFMGIGSEGHEAVRLGRKFIGIELKESYYRHAIKNIESAIAENRKMSLFDLVGQEA
jgi:DNA modification methylase